MSEENIVVPRDEKFSINFKIILNILFRGLKKIKISLKVSFAVFSPFLLKTHKAMP